MCSSMNTESKGFFCVIIVVLHLWMIKCIYLYYIFTLIKFVPNDKSKIYNVI